MSGSVETSKSFEDISMKIHFSTFGSSFGIFSSGTCTYVTKHFEVWDIWFLVCEFFFGCHAINCCCGCSIHDIDYSCYHFTPKVISQILLIQHGTCYFCNVHVFPFSNSILLWGITTWVLPLNSMFLQVFIVFIWKIVSPSIEPSTFDVHTLLLLHHCFKIQKLLKHFTFVFHEVNPHLPCVVINEIHVVPTSSNRFCFHGPHIWVDHFQ